MKRSLLGLLIGIGISLILTSLAGESPLHIIEIFYKSGFGSKYDLGLTLFYTTSLIFTGLSVSVAFHAGLFNIGAEGQLSMGALACVAFAVMFPSLPPLIAPFLAVSAGVLAAALWGAIPGLLKAWRGSHEVIVTMMMNFIAASVAGYVVLELIKNPDSQNPESKLVPAQYLLKDFDFIQSFFQDSPAKLSLVVAVAASLLLSVLLYRTRWGFELRAAGENEIAANIAGISGKKMKVLAMTLAGALAGLVCMNEILGSSGKFKIGFSPGYGFVGIAVALLAQNNPLAILASAFLFGFLQKGASDLDLETETITRDFAHVIQAIVIFSVAGAATFRRKK